MENKLIIVILEIISTSFMIISYILLITQSFNNYNFKNFKKKDLVTERLLYEQFSYEVNSNINRPLFSNTNNSELLNIYSFLNQRNSVQINMEIEMKLNSYYDCQGVNDDELNEEICQNKRINSKTCCRAECCIRTNGDEGNNIFCNDYTYNSIPSNEKILFYNDEEMFEDPRKRFCTYYNLYDTSKSSNELSNNQILYNFSNNYEELLNETFDYLSISKNIYNMSNIKDCGILNTKGHHLYLPYFIDCPINKVEIGNDNFFNYSAESGYMNNNKIIIRNIISDVTPYSHEWKDYYVNEEKRDLYSSVTIKDINKILDDANSVSIYDKYFDELNIEFLSINSNNINKYQKFSYYTTNYIGFENYSEYQKFKEIFTDEKDNYLYKIGNDIYPSLESIVIGFFLMALSLAYIIIVLLVFIKYDKETLLLILFIIKQILSFASFVGELIMYIIMICKFKNINIDMDERFKKILDLYNERRLQKLLLSSVILLVPSIIFLILEILLLKIRGNRPNMVISEEPARSGNPANNESQRVIQFTNSSQNINNNDENQNIIHNNPNNLHSNRQTFNQGPNNEEDLKSSKREMINTISNENKNSVNTNAHDENKKNILILDNNKKK